MAYGARFHIPSGCCLFPLTPTPGAAQFVGPSPGFFVACLRAFKSLSFFVTSEVSDVPRIETR
jgi:hypothetical protein